MDLKFNPIKALKKKADLLGTEIKSISVTSRNQTELLRLNVEIMQKQSKTLERWANAAEAMAEILQEISDTIKEKK